jgi:hypothetical protein
MQPLLASILRFGPAEFSKSASGVYLCFKMLESVFSAGLIPVHNRLLH